MSSGSVSLKSAEKHESHIVKIALKKKIPEALGIPIVAQQPGNF